MNKPTAQELWERIELIVQQLEDLAYDESRIYDEGEVLQHIKDYAQAYGEEQTPICPRCNNRTVYECVTIGCDDLPSYPPTT